MKTIKQSFIFPESLEIIRKARLFLVKNGGNVTASMSAGASFIFPSRQKATESTQESNDFEAAMNMSSSSSRLSGVIQSVVEIPPPPPGDDSILPPPSFPDEDIALQSEIAQAREERIRTVVASRNKATRAGQEALDLIERVKKALEDFEKSRLEKLLEKSRQLHLDPNLPELMTARDICFVMSDTQVIEMRLQKAMITNQISKIRSLIELASKLGIESLVVNEATKQIQSKIDASKSHLDETGRFRDYADVFNSYKVLYSASCIHILTLKNLYPLLSYPRLRDPAEFSRKGLFAAKKNDTGMLKFTTVKVSFCFCIDILRSQSISP